MNGISSPLRLLIHPTEFPPGPGGIGTHAHQVATQLTALGWEVRVVTPQDYVSQSESDAWNSQQPFKVVQLRRCDSTSLAKAVYRYRVLQGIVQSWRPDLILASGEPALWVTACCTLWTSIPWVAMGHAREFGTERRWHSKVTRWAVRQATGTICVSRYTQKAMRASGIETGVDCVIPNGADSELFHTLPAEAGSRVRQALGLHEARLLITLGNVSHRKGQDVVIRAMPQILKQEPNTHYLIVGLPTVRSEFEALAKSLGVADHVHFLGRLPADEIVRLLNGSDLFVMTSRHTADGDFEGFGIAVVEAALCGLPAVVSRNSGLVEAIADGETGIAVAENDCQATAAAIVSTLGDEKNRHRMAVNALDRALREQTWRHRAREYDEFLRTVCELSAARDDNKHPAVAQP